TAPLPVQTGLSPATVLAVIWAVGLLVLLLCGTVSYLRLHRQVATAVLLRDNIYQCDTLPTPFVLGFLHPRIYIPFHMTEGEQRCILRHEEIHIRRRDYLQKPLAYALLSVYWMNPLLWLAFSLFCRDLELSCDEAVLEELGGEARRDYSLSLLSFATARRFPATPAFGETDASRRVKHVLRWKPAAPRMAFLGVTVCLFAALALGTDAFPGATASSLQKQGQGSIETEQGRVTTTKLDYSLAQDVTDFTLYEEVYDHGKLIAVHPILQSDSLDKATRRGRLELGMARVLGEDGRSGIVWYNAETVNGKTDVFSTIPSAAPTGDYDSYGFSSLEGAGSIRLDAEVPAILILGSTNHGVTLPTIDALNENFAGDALAGTEQVVLLRMRLRKAPATDVSGGTLRSDGMEQKVGLTIQNFSYTLGETVQSFALVEEIYENGVLLSSTPVLMDNLGKDGAAQRQGTVSVAVEPEGEVPGAWDRLDWRVTLGGTGFNRSTPLPPHTYTSYAPMFLGQDGQKSTALTMGDSTIVYAGYLDSNQNDGLTAVSCEALNQDLMQAFTDNPCVLVLVRLALSADSLDTLLENLSATSAARTLYELRTPYIGDTSGDSALLEALGVGELGDYSFELETAAPPYILRVNFKDKPKDADALDRTMTRNACLLLALIGNAEEIQWSYPAVAEDGAETLLTVYFPAEQASEMVGGDVKLLGKSPVGVGQLLNALPMG
ncbi:MAG: M56 family metallopeptidase, partial [Oscillospiraceae bacterium]